MAPRLLFGTFHVFMEEPKASSQSQIWIVSIRRNGGKDININMKMTICWERATHPQQIHHKATVPFESRSIFVIPVKVIMWASTILEHWQCHKSDFSSSKSQIWFRMSNVVGVTWLPVPCIDEINRVLMQLSNRPDSVRKGGMTYRWRKK
jgi:hypothetical protein